LATFAKPACPSEASAKGDFLRRALKRVDLPTFGSPTIPI